MIKCQLVAKATNKITNFYDAIKKLGAYKLEIKLYSVYVSYF